MKEISQTHPVKPHHKSSHKGNDVKIVLIALIVFAIGFGAGKLLTIREFAQRLASLEIKGINQEKTYPLLKYSFSELAKRGGISSEIIIDRVLSESSEFTAYVFHYTSEGRKISGQLNVPVGASTKDALPVVLLMRGYVDPSDYSIGKGTSPTAAALAKAGYITFAPDFLGFGESDMPPSEPLAERFIKPMNVLDLYETVNSLDQKDLSFEGKKLGSIDARRMGLWGHSNGGQISLSFLEITEKPIPTALLAPVSKFFPYSVLYYTGESEDKGTGIISVIAKFEEDYNINEFTIGNRFDNVTAKIQLHQGSEDAEVPQKWSDEFYSYFAGKGKKDQIEYFVYEGADHLLIPATEQVKQKVVEFFDREVKNKVFVTPTATPTLLPSVTPIDDLERIEEELDSTKEASAVELGVTAFPERE